MKIAILGFGREGKSVLKFLKKRNPRADIKILDQKLDDNYLKNLNRFDVVFRSPGVPYNLPEIQKAIKKGVKFSSATGLFFDTIHGLSQTAHGLTQKNVRASQRQVRTSPRPLVIGITGTKGKGTTATLLYKILRACGKRVYLAGNIGKPAIELLSNISVNQRTHQRKSASTIIILELSSFQLQDLKKSPDIAAVLDVFPDHLDLHKNLREYFDAKANIAKWQKKTDKIFYFSDNRWSKWIASKSRAKKIAVDSRHSHEFVISHRDLKIPGEHNFKNAVMAATVALSLGCPKEKIITTIKKFRGNEHRLELIRTIHRPKWTKHGKTQKISLRKSVSSPHQSVSMIKFYNDSASTNPQTAIAAISSFKEPKILILGGKDKGLNYSPLAKALKNSNTKLVILFGENKNKIKKAIKKSKVPIKIANNLEEAVKAAYNYSRFYILDSKFSSIVFSPASASFDMFKDYADRGKKFKEFVKRLK